MLPFSDEDIILRATATGFVEDIFVASLPSVCAPDFSLFQGMESFSTQGVKSHTLVGISLGGGVCPASRPLLLGRAPGYPSGALISPLLSGHVFELRECFCPVLPAGELHAFLSH